MGTYQHRTLMVTSNNAEVFDEFVDWLRESWPEMCERLLYVTGVQCNGYQTAVLAPDGSKVESERSWAMRDTHARIAAYLRQKGLRLALVEYGELGPKIDYR